VTRGQEKFRSVTAHGIDLVDSQCSGNGD
jgi:hypothetical protein